MAADHLRQAIDNDLRQMIVDEAVKALQHEEFNTVVCSGISGLLIAPAVAQQLGKQLCVIRKQNEVCHSFNVVETISEGASFISYVFLDDLIDGGYTFHYVYDQMERFSPFSKLIGLYMYRQKVYAETFTEIRANHPAVKIITNNSEEYEDG
jgi:adenine/guanine phosphoribosyltransferase-like PRPP-binding protein